MAWLFALLALAGAWGLAYHRAPAWCWTATLAAGALFLQWTIGLSTVGACVLWVGVAAFALLTNPTPLRRVLIGAPLLPVFRRVLPAMSQTEQDAIDAGTVWWDGDLFSGRPDWHKLLAFPKPTLTAAEQAFLDGPVETLCAMTDDWQITSEQHDLPPHVWQFIKEQGFLGMIIPQRYGGKGFSALAHSEVVMKLTTRSGTAAVSVMVPNSLGPAELFLHYGTQAQKDYYLPRLAQGVEMPCFALTSPEAGSDAGSIPDFGVVCRGEWEGEREVLGIRLTWEKRYITLGPIATLLGLAFRLYDPDRLLGERADLGITLAVIPAATPGVHIGRRHAPLNAVFQNGPNWGKDVFVPMRCVIGGAEYAGQGWKMLMNCLAAGRSISLPANGTGIAKLAALTTGAYGRVRTQFKVAVGRFEGVEEAMARIGGNTYLTDAARVMTAGAVDLGAKPSVISAIVKYHLTERGRAVVNDAMDVHGGKGICMGPSNYLARAYQQTPIAITVEGANILTRSLIIFGQGAIRSHPWVLQEMAATREADRHKAVVLFDRALCGHIGFAISNFARTLWLGLTGARLVVAVPHEPPLQAYFQQLTRLSSAFAFAADLSMFVLGGALKRRERLSARLGDILSCLYLASATLKRYADDGRPAADAPLLHWAMQDTLLRTQDAFYGLFENFPSRPCAWLLRLTIFPWGRSYRAPSDRLGSDVVGLLMEPSATRERLTKGVYIGTDENEPVATLEAALRAVIRAEPIEAKLRAATRAGQLAALPGEQAAMAARDAGIISAAELEALEQAHALRRRAIMVDDFPQDLGRSELTQTTRAVTFESLQRPAHG